MGPWEEVGPLAVSIPQQIQALIVQLIESGRLSVGERLPPERWLAERLNVSRNSLRRALLELAETGYVASRARSGWEVAEVERRVRAEAPSLASIHGDHRTIQEVMDFRLAIEPAIAARAAHRRRRTELADLERPLLQAEDQVKLLHPSVERLQQLDVEFHSRVATASHNPLLSRLLQETQQWMIPTRQRSVQSPQRYFTSVQGHRAIYVAIEAGQADDAYQAMTQHLRSVHDVIRPLTNPLELLE